MEPSASLRTSRRSAIAPASGMHNRAGSVPTSSTIAREEAEEWWSTYTKTATSMIQEAPSFPALAAHSSITCRFSGRDPLNGPPVPGHQPRGEAAEARGSSPLLVVDAEKDDVEFAEPGRVAVQRNTGDLPVADGEREDDLRPAAGRPHGRRNAVSQSEPGSLSPAREGSPHRVGTADLGGRAHLHGRWVGHEHGVRIEQRQQGAEIPAPRGSQE